MHGSNICIGKHTIRILKRINEILKDIERGGYEGIGKPEPLGGNLSGLWSRRIDQEHRLVYKIQGEICEIIQCKGHYKDS